MDDQINHLFKSTAEIKLDENEESLSLPDLPLNTVDYDHDNHGCNHSRRSSSDSFFEFHVNRDVASPQNEVISRGRLLPFKPPPPQPPAPRRSFSLSSATTRAAAFTRCESPFTESALREIRTIRPCRSLDGRKIRRNSSSKSEPLSRNSSKNNRNNSSETKPSLPPWYWLAFGIPAKISSEMELKDIKNRQIRRSLPPSGSFPSNRSSAAASWKVLNVLSCKSHASVDDVIKRAPFYSRSLRNI